MSRQELNHIRKMQRKDEKVRLQGFTSASTDQIFVERELLRKSTEQRGKVPVLLRMQIDHNNSTTELNRPSLSPYHQSEMEVVLEDGLAFRFASGQQQ